MNDDERSHAECERYGDELAELALGILPGKQRADVLAHIEGCPRCRGEVEQLSVAADSILEVVPAAEPPIGFEVRLMERLDASRARARALKPRHRFRQRRFGMDRFGQSALVFASLALLAALGVGIGWLTWGSSAPTTGSAFGTTKAGHLAEAQLVSAGRPVGEVYVYTGQQNWLFMSLSDQSPWSGEATCEARLANGSTVVLGKFWMSDGNGAWAVPLQSGTARIKSATVLATDGTVLARAQFTSGSSSSAADSKAAGAAPVAGPPWTVG
jgi:Putative zinc-finger